MNTDPKVLNRRLSRINLVTSLGDFVSLFAILVLLHDQTGKIEIAAYAIPLKALGIALGGAIFPWTLTEVPVRTLMIWTQFNSAVVMALIAVLAYSGVPPWIVYVLLVLQTVLKQLFVVRAV
jgi:hypothetical protein